MDDNLRIVRQIGEQQAHNSYLRDCYTLLKATQDLTEKTAEDLHKLYRSLDTRPGYTVHEIIRKFQNNVLSLIEKACESQAACEELCQLDMSYSARVVFEPIRRMYTEADVTLDGQKTTGPYDCT
ncbi:uncharacterized protein N7483_002547 [Penicillium malachiteum]|uniref:uncharacterized protein n=1 Tax=Penicillium malachiteum TaxID=1324776 RepID=UPI002547E580|nr:uncharacterized protein N7483_002415 [Penicillium malachiteum]XP_056952133.1 uncharacterized protein N7483_002547 [Penicillium malachiteum]KAJ5737290.1 hypothetical protein N7483_002415 [Penicillium malachiteum]KAJ5737422.1 hypothetical protein N7483_002547 [Penicillium malachiteum]